jgi:hypothetical protein
MKSLTVITFSDSLPLNISGWPSSLSSNTCNLTSLHLSISLFILEILSSIRGKGESGLNAMLITITSKNYQKFTLLSRT